MKKFLLASVVALAAGSAIAADLPTRAPIYKAPIAAAYNWTGFYLGINGGGGWGRTTWADPTPGTGSYNTTGWLIGGTAGYNWQAAGSPLVLGIEADIDAANIKGSGNSIDCLVLRDCQTRTTWLATARGRAGYAMDRWLAYITGGAAFGNIKASSSSTAEESSSRTGWTLGGGAEYAFAGPWSLKVEYLYVDLGDFNCGVGSCGIIAPTNVNHRFNVVRGGINSRF